MIRALVLALLLATPVFAATGPEKLPDPAQEAREPGPDLVSGAGLDVAGKAQVPEEREFPGQPEVVAFGLVRQDGQGPGEPADQADVTFQLPINRGS